MTEQQDEDYWYFHRRELRPEMVFRTSEGNLVRLDRDVPGDGTKWYVDRWNGDGWSSEDATIEPGDLRGQPLPEPARLTPNDPGYWYHHWDQLRHGMVFKTNEDHLVKLDGRVPHHALKWQVASWDNGWVSSGATVECDNLRGQPLPEPARTSPTTLSSKSHAPR